MYVEKLDALKVLGDPITFRYKEADERSKIVSQLRATINQYMTQASSDDEKYSHIDPKDKQSIIEKCATIQKWLEDQIVRQSERAKNVEPVLKSADVLVKRDEIIYFATPILTRPKPKPPKVEQPAGTETPKSGQQTPKPEGQPQGEQPPPASESQTNEPPEMDID